MNTNLHGQDTIIKKINIIENKIENFDKLITVQSSKSDESNDRAKEILEFASKLIDWTGLFFAAITVIFLIASITGFRELSEIRTLRNAMKEQQDKIESELIDIQNIKKEILLDNLSLRNKIEKESNDFLKIIYLSNQGVTNYHTGKLYDAESTFKEILKINPTDYRAMCYLARSYFGQKKYAIALETIIKAALIEENSPYAYTIMGEIYRMVGRLDDAIIAFNKSISIEPTPSTYSSLGYTFTRKADYENAIRAFQSALEFRRYSTPTCGLAKALLKSKQISKAMKYFDETIILAEEDIKRGSIYIWPYYNLTFSLLLKDRKSECLNALAIALERNPNPEVIKEQLEEYNSMLNEEVPQVLLSECIKLFEKKIQEIM